MYSSLLKLPRIIPAVLTVLTALLLLAHPAQAAGPTCTVTDSGDSGPGTLRQCVTDVDTGGVIDFSLTYPDTITLTSQIDLTKALTINGPGAENVAVSGDNITRTFRVDAATDDAITINGLTLRDGYTATDGGAILHNSGTLTITNAVIAQNNADRDGGGIASFDTLTILGSTIMSNTAAGSDLGGGGLLVSGATALISDTTISANQSTTDDGGGVTTAHSAGSAITISNSLIQGNSATDDGAGLKLDNTVARIENTRIINNGNAIDGGAMHIDYGSSVTLLNDTLSGNHVEAHGGAIYVSSSADALVITATDFISNTAASFGGAINNNGGSLTLTNVDFSGNSSSNSSGGAIYNTDAANPVLTNIIFSGNRAAVGGALYNNNSNPQLINVTFSSNLAHLNPGGAIANFGTSNILLVNGVVWGNSTNNDGFVPGAQIYNAGGAIAISYTLIQSDTNNVHDIYDPGGNVSIGPGVITTDPLFVTPITATVAPTTTGNYRLQVGSPAIDAGDNSAVPSALTSDLDGSPRIQGGTVDMGAYEATPPSDVVISKSVSPAGAKPGDTVTYTLTFSNAGPETATGVVIIDNVPASVTNPGVAGSSGAVITLTGAAPNFAWQVEDLAAGDGGVITLTGVVSSSLAAGVFTNTAEITVTGDIDPANNTSSAAISTCGNTVTVQNAADSGAGSLRQAVADICPGGVIDFAPALNGSTITLTGQIDLTKALTIAGPGAENIAVSGNNASRIFNISQPVSISGLTLRDGKVTGTNNGGAIQTVTPLTLTAVTIYTNTAYWGGGVYALANVTVSDSRIEDNTATGPDISNDIRHGGGGMHVTGQLVLTNTDVIANRTSGDGGGISVRGDAIITGGHFERNATVNQNIGSGAAMAITGTLWLSGTQVISNTGGQAGGAIIMGEGDAERYGNATLINSYFEQNQSTQSSGGALYTYGNLVVTNTQFLTNTAYTKRGAAYAKGNITISDSLFQSNAVLDGAEGWAGALEVGGTLAITHSDFISNTAATSGGAIVGYGEFDFSNSRFIGNHAGTYGGAIEGGSPLSISASAFEGNTAATYGGALVSYSTLTITDSTFISNKANSEQGGAVVSSGDTVITGSHFISNTAVYAGAMDAQGILVLTSSEFISNTAATYAGAIFLNNNATLSGLLLQGNRATTQYGGALVNNYNTVSLSDSTITNNQAGTHGGGIYSEYFPLNIYNSTISGNTATQNGGGIYNLNDGDLGVYTSTLTGNAAANGGAIYNTDTGSIVQLFASTLADNRATTGGGAMYNAPGATTAITGSYVYRNNAASGGGLYAAAGVARVANGLFIGNEATANGAAIYAAATTQILHTTIASPTLAARQAIYINGGTVTIRDTIVASYTTGIQQAGGTATADYNLFFGNTTHKTGTIGGGTGEVLADPLFIDPAGGDYRLLNGSPAVGAGTDVGVATDILGQGRANPPTIGAYENPVQDPSSDATLTDLQLQNVTLSRVFASRQSTYTATVRTVVNQTVVTPTSSVTGATITVNGVPVASGTPSGVINLALGANVITTVVTAPDSVTQQTYVVTVTRAWDGPFYVDKATGDDSNLCDAWGAGRACKTIGGAIAKTVYTDTTIYIAAGDYDGNLTVSMPTHFVGSGVGATFVDGRDTWRVFTVNGASTWVSLTDLTVQNGRAATGQDGGGISSSALLTLTNVNVLSNATSLGGRGGGVYATAGLSLSNVIVENNSTASGGGGGLYLSGPFSGAEVTINNNRSTSGGGHGGGIYANGELSLADGITVTNNSVTNANGGGIYATGALTLTNVWVHSNSASNNQVSAASTVDNGAYGGGVYAGSTIWISGGNYQNNQVNATGSSYGIEYCSDWSTWTIGSRARGGALYVASTAIISGATFSDNSATGVNTTNDCGSTRGGAVYANNSLTLVNSRVLSNTATRSSRRSANSNGGGIYTGGEVAVVDSEFRNNRAQLGSTIAGNYYAAGGGLYTDGTSTISGAVFEANLATENAGSAGVYSRAGGLYAGNSSAITATTFLSNSVKSTYTEYGGGMFANNYTTIQGGVFQGNTTDALYQGWGAGLHIQEGGGTLSGTLFIRNRIQSSTTAGYGGGMSTYRDVTLINTQFLTNSVVLGDGGGLYASNSNINLSGGLFQGNSGRDGGGIYMTYSSRTISGTRFIQNTATGNGGGMYTVGGSWRAANNLFIGNSAGTKGAAIYSNSGTGRIYYNDITGQALNPLAAIHGFNATYFITNTIVTSHAVGIQRDSGSTLGTVSADYNLFFANTANKSGTIGGGANDVLGDPLFVDPIGGDYRVRGGSPALSKGLAVVDVTTDSLGEPRGNPPTIGAYELPLLNPDNNAYLTNLQLQNIPLTPDFGSAIISYTASVPRQIASTVVTPTTTVPTATLTVNGIPVNSGSPSGVINLIIGVNPITTVITAPDNTTVMTYTVVITRRPWEGPFYVEPTVGNDSNECQSFAPGEACRTIGGAISKATLPGTYIYIAPGVYTENLTATLPLHFVGSGVDSTIVDGGQLGRVFLITNTTALISFRDLIVQNGRSGGSGGGIYATGALSLTNVNVLSNTTASGDGGGLYAAGVVTLTNVSVLSNTVNNGNGGGLYAAGAIMLTNVSVLSNTATSTNTSSTPPTGNGGGVYATGAAALLNVTVSRNVAIGPSNKAGGMYTGGAVQMTGSLFAENVVSVTNDYASSNGGGLYVSGALVSVDTNFHRNSCTGGTRPGYPCTGGGLYANSTAVMTNTAFVSNTAVSPGRAAGAWTNGDTRIAGGLFQQNIANPAYIGGTGGAIYQNNDNTIIKNTLFISNTAYDGAAVYRGGNTGKSMVVDSSRFIANYAGNQGGAFSQGGAAMLVTNTLFARNTALNNGAVIYNRNTASTDLKMWYSTIVSPTVGANAAIYQAYAPWGITIRNTIIASYTTSIYHVTVNNINSDYNLFYNAPTAGVIGTHSLTGQDPLFFDMAADNYHLKQGSPAVGAGLTIAGVTTDLDGLTRANPPTIGAYDGFYASPDLSSLELSHGTLTPVFASATTGYTATVAYGVLTITLTSTTVSTDSTITVNGAPVISGTASAPIALEVGENFITTTVTASSGLTKPYVVVVSRASDATLRGLTIAPGALTPAFINTTLAYTAAVGNLAVTTIVTPTASPGDSLGVTVAPAGGSETVCSGPPTQCPLLVGDNVITTTVTSLDGAMTNSYVITVTRAPSDNADLASVVLSDGVVAPAFAPATTAYTATVAHLVTSVTLTPTTSEPNATITVNGTPVISGTESGPVSLPVGQTGITVTVTAQDGVTTKDYLVTVVRSGDATLSGLELSVGPIVPAFISTTLAYTTSDLPRDITSTVVTAPTTYPGDVVSVTIAYNGGAAITCTGSSPATCPMAPGVNVITITVIAVDGSSQAYTVTMLRASEATLSDLRTDTGALRPAFVSSTFVYTTPAVAYGKASAIVTATTAFPGDAISTTVAHNGAAEANCAGDSPATCSLAVGANAISVTVTAADGLSKTYTVGVVRASAGRLSDLEVSVAPLVPAFISTTQAYTTTDLPNDVTSAVVTATTAFPGDAISATVAHNGGPAIACAVSSQTTCSLSPGVNVITVTVIAADGSERAYTVTMTRASDATLSDLETNTGALQPAFVSSTLAYTTPTAAYGLASAIVTATTAFPGDGLSVSAAPAGGAEAACAGLFPATCPLTVGANAISVTVTAADGLSKTYTIGVVRAGDATLSDLAVSVGPLAPAFISTTLAYTTGSVGSNVASTLVTATTTYPGDAITTVVAHNGDAATACTGSAPATCSLAVGVNVVTVTVTSIDGASRHYTVTISRASTARLSNLAVSVGPLVPTFISTTLAYTTGTVSNNVTSAIVTATVAHPGDAISTIVAYNGGGSVACAGSTPADCALAVGVNVITVTVTTADGSSHGYTVTIVRASAAQLTELAVSVGALAPTFVSTTPAYTTTMVSNSITSTLVTATVAFPSDAITTTVSHNGGAATACTGSAPATCALAVGVNVITVTVTAADGSSRDYTVTISRAPSNTASLSSLVLSNGGSLNPPFDPATTSYTTTIANTRLTVTPTSSEPNATITVNGAAVTSGSASAQINLNMGVNFITTTVTAEDGVTTRTYTISVTRTIMLYYLPIITHRYAIRTAATAPDEVIPPQTHPISANSTPRLYYLPLITRHDN